jgi:23S rRNA pseudouridine1911/1915/1917 synthase
LLNREKLNILEQNNDYIAVNKPANIVLTLPTPQLIYSLDSELSGIVLLAKDQKICATLRNMLGSDQILFYFFLIAQTISNLEDEIVCDLPIARHRSSNYMLISHTTGKKAVTKFKKIEIIKSYTLWSAETKFLRRHQIRLHAHEIGIPILGENYYRQVPIPLLSDLKKNVKLNRKGIPSSLYNSICIHLSQIVFPWESKHISMKASLPSKLDSMLKIIEKWN